MCIRDSYDSVSAVDLGNLAYIATQCYDESMRCWSEKILEKVYVKELNKLPEVIKNVIDKIKNDIRLSGT